MGSNALLWLPAGSGGLTAPFNCTAYLVAPIEHAGLAFDATPHNTAAATGHSDGCGCGIDHSAFRTSVAPPPSSVSAAAAAAAHPSMSHDAETSARSSTNPATVGAAAKPVYSVAVVTVSDRCAAGSAVDKSGPAVSEFLSSASQGGVASFQTSYTAVVADEPHAIQQAVMRRARRARPTPQGATPLPECDLVITTGGTGLGPRDCTPEALRPLIARPAHGLVHAMLAEGRTHTPLAALSRYEAGVLFAVDTDASGELVPVTAHGTRSGSLLIQLPGSVAAVKECLGALAVLLPHALRLVTS